MAAPLDPGADAVLSMRQTWRRVERIDLSFPGGQWDRTRDETLGRESRYLKVLGPWSLSHGGKESPINIGYWGLILVLGRSSGEGERDRERVSSLSCVRLFVTPWTVVAYQAPPSMGFSRQEYWSGLPFPSPEDLPDPGVEPRSPAL